MSDPSSHFSFIPYTYTSALTSPRRPPAPTALMASPRKSTIANRKPKKDAAAMPANKPTATGKSTKNGAAASSSKNETAPASSTAVNGNAAAASPPPMATNDGAAPPVATEVNAVSLEGALEMLKLASRGPAAIKAITHLHITIDPHNFDDYTDDMFSMAIAAFHAHPLTPAKVPHSLKKVTITIIGNVIFTMHTSIIVSPCASRNAPAQWQAILTEKEPGRFQRLINNPDLVWHHSEKAIVKALTAIRGVEEVEIQGPLEVPVAKKIVKYMTTKAGEEAEIDGNPGAATTTKNAPLAQIGVSLPESTGLNGATNPTGATDTSTGNAGNNADNNAGITPGNGAGKQNKRKAGAMAPPPAPSTRSSRPRSSKRVRLTTAETTTTTAAAATKNNNNTSNQLSQSPSSSSSLSSVDNDIIANGSPPSLPPSALTAPATIPAILNGQVTPVRILALPQTLDEFGFVPSSDVGVPTKDIVEKRGHAAQERARKREEQRRGRMERARKQKKEAQGRKRSNGSSAGESGEAASGSASAGPSDREKNLELGKLPGGIASMGWFDRTEGEGEVRSVRREEWVLPTGKGGRVVVGGRVG
ncbi:hypothetical protein K490DRAFT_64655 [Saccharata proteae CBS 121410]|uniref:Uncharacterized protein n=1 Tax=Saccharata proteae CBS 121410 TaxID=1314787 RepID=A0A9P4LXX8_9PEZI|nr:hypothetical protein K490DRAFT_64655 [Saccharata proteae CBS 121410]